MINYISNFKSFPYSFYIMCLSLGNIMKLGHFSASSNCLTGSIPSAYCSLTSLTTLSLGMNRLIGTITFISLRFNSLDSSVNSLTGSVPAEIGSITILASLNLRSNRLGGPIPSSLGSLSLLITLFLHTNSFTGTVPSSLASLTKLQTLYLQGNSLALSYPSGFNHFIDIILLESICNSACMFISSDNSVQLSSLIFSSKSSHECSSKRV